MRGSGLRTGKLSPPPTAAKYGASPSAASSERAAASGLLVQTASRQPSSRQRAQPLGDARDTARLSTAACAP